MSLFRSLTQSLITTVEPVLERFATVGLIQSAVVLAAQTFMALFPLLIGIIALAPSPVSDAVTQTLQRRLGLDGDTGVSVQHLVASRDDLRGGLTVIGLLVVLASATSFTRALQRVYENAWQLPRLGMKGSLRGLEWLVGIVVYVALVGFTIRLTESSAFYVTALRFVVLATASVTVWWLTPFVLLCGRVRMRAMMVTGAVTSIALLIASALSAEFVPRIIHKNEAQYGTIGAAFAIQSWLVVMGSIIVGAAIVGALVAQSRGRIGTWARGSADPEWWRRNKPPSRIVTAARRRIAKTGGSTNSPNDPTATNAATAADPEPPD
jgi:membrane protein